LEGAHGQAERERVENRGEGLVERELGKRVRDVELGLGDGFLGLLFVEEGVVVAGCRGEGFGCGAEGVGGESEFEELLPGRGKGRC
jgi:hypothetical protein